jgi:hypothetical protein
MLGLAAPASRCTPAGQSLDTSYSIKSWGFKGSFMDICRRFRHSEEGSIRTYEEQAEIVGELSFDANLRADRLEHLVCLVRGERRDRNTLLVHKIHLETVHSKS